MTNEIDWEAVAADQALTIALLKAELQKPLAMRMPKVGDRVVCIEDDSFATIVGLTGGGSPEINFDDGSRGTYLLREFADLFRYENTVNQCKWNGLTDQEIEDLWNQHESRFDYYSFSCDIEAKLKEKNT